jgi:MFS family permease
MNINHKAGRWLVVVGAILIQLALGALYAWSVFTGLLTDPDGIYRFTATQTAWIFSAGLATFALVMVLAGRWQAKTGPRLMSMLGGLLLGLGFVLGGLFGSTFWAQFLFIGVVAGAGIGLAYVVPIAVGVKWFPDKKGMITGLAVAGFGFGATIWVKLAGSWFGGLLNTTGVLGLPGVQSVFLIYGVVFAALVLLGSLVMVDPPEGYRPAGWAPAEAKAAEQRNGNGYLPGQMLRTRQFYAVWLVFASSAIAGLMVIYCIQLFGIDALAYRGVENALVVTGTAMAWYAIFNGLGRILWGMISDRIGRKNAIIAMSAGRQAGRPQLRLGVHGLWCGRDSRPIAGGRVQGLGRGRRFADRLDDAVPDCGFGVPVGGGGHAVYAVAAPPGAAHRRQGRGGKTLPWRWPAPAAGLRQNSEAKKGPSEEGPLSSSFRLLPGMRYCSFPGTKPLSGTAGRGATGAGGAASGLLSSQIPSVIPFQFPLPATGAPEQ